MILFRDAVAMVQQSPELTKRLVCSGTGQNIWNLAYLKSGSFSDRSARTMVSLVRGHTWR